MKKVLGLLLVLTSVLALFACGEQEHVHDYSVKHEAVAATCTQEGNVEYYECSADGALATKVNDTWKPATADSVKVAKLAHTLTHHEAVEVTFDEAGSKEYWECSVCGKFFKNEGATEEFAANEWVIPVHDHDFVKHDAKEASCDEAGSLEYYQCSVCEKLFTKDGDNYSLANAEDLVVPAKGHSCGDEATPLVKPTADQAGNMAYYTCTACGKKFADKEANELLADGIEVLPAYGHYTLNDFMASTAALQWNPLTWETSDDSSILGYLSMGFYDYRVKMNADGTPAGEYEIVCEMASALPVDVTSEYVGSFGVEEGQERRAWRIALNPNAKWQNGDPITADDYVSSMKHLISGDELNRRADSVYGGDFSYVNAQAYLYSDRTVKVPADELYNMEYSEDLDDKLFFQWDMTASTKSYFSAWLFDYKSYLASYGPTWCDLLNNGFGANITVTDDDLASLNGKTFAEIKADPTMKAIWDQMIGFWQTEPSEELHFFLAQNSYPHVDWDEVGFKKVDEYTIDIIIEQPLENPEFYLPYYLSSTYLVHEATYQAAWTTDGNGERTNLYNKDLEHTMSYGPYVMTSYEDGKQITFARNNEWYGYFDTTHVINGTRLYQTTNVKIDVISGHQTQLLAFKQGKVDGVGLQSEDLDEFGQSQYKMLTPQSYTTKLTINTWKEKLEENAAKAGENINKTILLEEDFRHAFALSFDRALFCSSFTAGHTAGYGMFNYLYQYFGFDGLTHSYRDSDAAKNALVRVYGLAYGEGEEYETLDEAYEAITGYDVNTAKRYFVSAIEKALADGNYTEGQVVEIEFTVYQNDDIYVNMFNFFDTALQALAKDTILDGKIHLKMNVDDDYYNTMYAGGTDIIFSTWGGAQYNTLGIMSNCYTDGAYHASDNQMEVGFETEHTFVVFNIDGEDRSYSLKAWADWLNAKANTTNEDIDTVLGSAQQYAPELRVALFAELEYTYQSTFIVIPLYYRQNVSLRSMKINYPSEDYIDIVGHGGLSQMTYNYDDAQWAQFIADQGGELDYQ